MPANVQHISFIGFGEVGQTFARDLLRRDDVSVSAYDILVDRPAGSALIKRAGELGVLIHTLGSEAVRGADIVISAVTASQSAAVAKEARAWLQPGQIFFDLNSASPTTKRTALAEVEAAGAHYVEGAVMAPVLKPGLAVPILTGGRQADALSERLNALGMNLTPVATEIGLASAMKLCRSIMIKGIEALMVDCTAACEHWGVKDPVFATLAETFPSIDWHATSANMCERVATHGVRRAAEMHEAAEMLADMGLNPDLAAAVANAQLRGARKAGDAS